MTGDISKEGEFEKARAKFQEVINLVGAQPDIQYNIALCHYKMGQYGPALKALFDIIDHGVRDHPGLCCAACCAACCADDIFITTHPCTLSHLYRVVRWKQF